MEFKIVKSKDECASLWKEFSPNENWWDLWETRECFLVGERVELYFIVGYDGKEVLGILPLWHDRKTDAYTWVGGEFPENNKFFIKSTTGTNLR